jgi:hypothetical protein
MSRSRIEHPDYTTQLRCALRRHLPAKGLPLMGPDRWSDRLLVMAILLMVFSPLHTLQERLAEARSVLVKMYRSRRRPGRSYAGFMAKLQAHSSRLLAVVVPAFQARVRQVAGAHWKIGRHLAFAVDGSKSDAPRTRANRRSLKIGGKRKSGPQQLLVVLWHVGTGLLWSWRRGEATASERELLTAQLSELPGPVLLLADAGFVGYGFITALRAAGHDVLLRAGANVQLLQKLGWEVVEHGDWVYLWPQKARQRGEPPLILRRIVLVDGRNRRMCLLTSVLAPVDLTTEEARQLYRRRWGIEVFYRGLKQTLGRRKMLSDSPANARVELDWTVAGYWLLGLLLWENRPEKVPVGQGIAQALRLVRSAMAGRGDGRRSLTAAWQQLAVDRYVRLRPKRAGRWAHKKNEPPCGTPKVRMATAMEVRRAKRLALQIHAA